MSVIAIYKQLIRLNKPLKIIFNFYNSVFKLVTWKLNQLNQMNWPQAN